MTTPETLAGLISDAAGTGRPLTFEALAQRCVDPESGYTPSANLVWKASRGPVKIHPALVRALAAGLRLPLERVQAAAAAEYIIGVEVTDPFADDTEPGGPTVRVAHREGLTGQDMPRTRQWAEDAKDSGDRE